MDFQWKNMIRLRRFIKLYWKQLGRMITSSRIWTCFVTRRCFSMCTFLLWQNSRNPIQIPSIESSRLVHRLHKYRFRTVFYGKLFSCSLTQLTGTGNSTKTSSTYSSSAMATTHFNMAVVLDDLQRYIDAVENTTSTEEIVTSKM